MDIEAVIRIIVEGVFLIPFGIYVRLKMNNLDSKIESLSGLVMTLLKRQLDGD